MYGVHRTCAEMAAVSCGTSHASAVSTPLRWIFKNALKNTTTKTSHSCRIICERNESARQRRIALYTSDQQQQQQQNIVNAPLSLSPLNVAVSLGLMRPKKATSRRTLKDCQSTCNQNTVHVKQLFSVGNNSSVAASLRTGVSEEVLKGERNRLS